MADPCYGREAIGARIRAIRGAEGDISQERLAELLPDNVTRSLVSKWERGWSEPQRKDVAKLLEIYGYNFDFIFAGLTLTLRHDVRQRLLPYFRVEIERMPHAINALERHLPLQ